jgi:hypothetical protein
VNQHIAVVSDTHCGCRLGLAPPTTRLDDGGEYRASEFQLKLYDLWNEYWRSVDAQVGEDDLAVVCTRP